MSRRFQESISHGGAIYDGLSSEETEILQPNPEFVCDIKGWILDEAPDNPNDSSLPLPDGLFEDLQELCIKDRIEIINFLKNARPNGLIARIEEISSLCNKNPKDIVDEMMMVEYPAGLKEVFEKNFNDLLKIYSGDYNKLAHALKKHDLTHLWDPLIPDLIKYHTKKDKVYDRQLADFIVSSTHETLLVLENLEKFKQIDYQKFFEKMLDIIRGNYIPKHSTQTDENIQFNKKIFIYNFDKLKDHVQGAEKLSYELTINGSGKDVADKIENFPTDFKEKYEELYTEFLPVLKGVIAHNEWPEFTKEDAELITNKDELKKKGLDRLALIEVSVLAKQNKLINEDYSTEEKQKQLFETFTEELEEWQDEQNISGPFENGAEQFGYKKMFAYIDRKDLTHHDALHNFDKILELLEVSDLDTKQFYAQILEQVNKDGSGYGYGGQKTAHHEMNIIADNIRQDINSTIEEAREYSEIETLQKLLEELSTPDQVFSSWKSLKKYSELCQLLGKTEILDQLKELKGQPGKEKLYAYVEKLAFHPDIDMQSVMTFWREPDEFLGTYDSHTPDEVHKRKKPSNYTHIKNLDLDAFNLRDALVEGDIDSLQAFQPLEIEYELPAPGQKMLAPYELLRDAVGMRSMKLKGKAQNPGLVFKEVQGYLKKQGIKLNFKNYLSGEANLPSDVDSELVNIVKKYYNPKIESVEYRAKVNLKSDPDGVVAGNDTVCCMPFGSGKNNVYTFNPVCSLFTIQEKKSDGSWRTVAQSVLTKDKNVNKNVAELMKKVNSSNEKSMQNIIPEEILRQSVSTAACDNIELAPGVKDENHIEEIYHDFMAEYMERFAEEENLDSDQVVIGKGYSDSLTHLPQIDNVFLPAAPVGYSDKTHEKVYKLEPKKSQSIISKNVIEKRKQEVNQEFSTNIPGVSQLTFEDSLPVAYIEGKAYHDNTTLIESLHKMENSLIAKDISNASKDRPNMSLKYTDKDGKMHGYMLAYEGKGDKDEETSVKDEKILYVADIASDGEVKGVGGPLMVALLEQYKKNYVDKDNIIPIYAEMRDQTSYAIVKSKLNDYAKNYGMQFEMEELGTYNEGADTMHQVVLRLEA